MTLAASLNIPYVTGQRNYSITQLVWPSGLTWIANNTTLTQRAGTNLCALRNNTESFTTRTDANLRLSGRLFIDCNGINQANTEAGGVLTTGVRLTGVDGLDLSALTVYHPRRYGIFLINCRAVRGDPTVIHDPALNGVAVNRDGVHINGNSIDVRFGQVTIENGTDDALALNADDVAQGGNWSQANVSGPIAHVDVGQLILRNCYNGLRLLSATKSLTDVHIGQIVGDVAAYAVNTGDYGLGAASWYKNIRIDSVSVDYTNNPAGSTLGLVNISVANPLSTAISDFWIGNIDRGQVGTVGATRETIQAALNRTNLVVDRLIERFCSNPAAVTLTGAGAGNVFHLKQLFKIGSTQSGGFWSSGIVLSNDTAIDVVKLGIVDCDFLRNLVVSTNSHIALLDIETFPVTTPANGALSFTGASQIVDMLICRNPNNLNLSATFRYTLASSATVTREWPNYNTGTTAQRPTNSFSGDSIFDATLNKLITWNGTVWKDGSGATV